MRSFILWAFLVLFLGPPALEAAEPVPAEFLGVWAAEGLCGSVPFLEVTEHSVVLTSASAAQTLPVSDVCRTCAGGSAYSDPLSCAGGSAYAGIEVQITVGLGGSPPLLLRFNARERLGDLLVKAGPGTAWGPLPTDHVIFRRCD